MAKKTTHDSTKSKSKGPNKHVDAEARPEKVDGQTQKAVCDVTESKFTSTEKSKNLEEDLSQHSPSTSHTALNEFAELVNGGSLSSSDDVCVSFIDALKQVITSYSVGAEKSFSREFEYDMDNFLKSVCKTVSLPVGVQNLVRQLKHHVHNLPDDTQENEAKEKLIDLLTNFTEEQIQLALKAISLAFQMRLKKAPDRRHVILSYGRWTMLEHVLCDAHLAGIKFELVLIDSFPKQPSKALLKNLAAQGINCSYMALSALNFIVREANLVLIEADGVLGNGNILAPLGTSSVCLAAKSNNIPVLVLAQTYKFCERLVTGTINPVFSTGKSVSSAACASEVVPVDLISGIITEIRILPCSSVPAVIKAKMTL